MVTHSDLAFLHSFFLHFRLGLSNFGEPCHIVYDVESKDLATAARAMRAIVSTADSANDDVLARCRKQRVDRVVLMNEATEKTVNDYI